MKSLFKNVLGLVLVHMLFVTSLKAQNLLNLQGWTIGTGAAGTLYYNGLLSENSRVWGDGPQGKRVILWRGKPSGDSEGDGGWTSGQFNINHANMYRFTVWLKKTNSFTGNSYLGCNNVLNLNGVVNSNAYFWFGKLPQLNRWYLVVGYIHGSGDESTISYGGVYDGVTGIKVINGTDFKFAVGTTTTNHRSYLFYDTNVDDEQFFYAPRVDVINGDEPSLASLLGLETAVADQSYFAGKVGIKTPNPGNYDLAVNGNVRVKEIKVETANWPDYVFEKSYALPSLEETEKHIKEKGHLPGIPSAKEAESSGIDLGEMNAKLLKKIEELTLHLIELKKENERQFKDIEQLKSKRK